MKKLLTMFLSVMFVFLLSVVVLASDKISVTDKNINIKKNNIVVEGQQPVVSGLKNTSFQKSVNNKIEDIIKKSTSLYSNKTSIKIEVSYEVIEDKDIISILIYFKNIYTNEVTPYSVNIDIKNNKYVYINSYLGANGVNYANKVVLKKSNEMGFSYKKVSEKSPFYIKNDNVYIVFGAGSITFSQKGNIIFEIPSEKINNYQINKNKYYKKSEYNVKMVPLREPLEYFGYTMRWEDSKDAVTILKDEQFISYLVIGKNRYSHKNNKAIIQLEFSPEIIDGKTYVPISYFSQILELLFAVDNNENIVLSSYKV